MGPAEDGVVPASDPYREQTVAMLQGQHELPHGPEGIVFHSDGRCITRGTAGEAWRDVKTKVPGVGTGWHELRHFHASQLIAGGMSPVAVAHRLGHKDATETLKTYAHLWPDDDTRAATITDGVVKLIAPEKPPEAEAA